MVDFPTTMGVLLAIILIVGALIWRSMRNDGGW